MKTSLAVVSTLALLAWTGAVQAGWKVASEKTVAGFGHPESVAYDSRGKVLYVSRFGPEFEPLKKDGKGYVSRVDLSGQVLEDRYLPASPETLHKPKGVWVAGDRLWTTDIDSVWVFDLKTRKGARAALPGALFANDPVVGSNRLFVSDMRGGRIYAVEPADFLQTAPSVGVYVQEEGLSPNGLWIDDGGALLIGTMPGQGASPRICRIAEAGRLEPVASPVGGVDGLAVLRDGTILYTAWAGKGLFALGKDGKSSLLSGGFSGPADFAVVPEDGGYKIIVPDLVKGELRIILLEPGADP